MILEGRVENGIGQFRQRMIKYAAVFTKAAGEPLRPGTLNVKVDREIQIQEDFRIVGKEIEDPEQDLRFEKCSINDIPAYRIRPFNLLTGGGGHGDDILEIACAQEIPDVPLGRIVRIEFFRES